MAGQSNLQTQIRDSIYINAGDGPDVDAFGRLRVSDPYTLFDGKNTFDSQGLIFDEAETAGSGTSTSYSSNAAAVTMSVGDGTEGTRVRQSKFRPAYQPGKSQQFAITFTLGTAVAGVTRRVGAFDEKNGLFLEQTGTQLALVVRSFRSGTAVDTRFDQSSWNIDPLDGSGISGVTLDVTKSQILVCDFEWLGVGRVRWGFNINGQTNYVHEYAQANHGVGVYMSTGNLPVRYEIVNDGSGGPASLECICSTVQSEGGTQFTGREFAIDRGSTGLTTLDNANLYPLLAMRLKPTHLGATVRPVEVNVICTSTADWRWALLLNPDFTGTTLSYSGVANSAVDACTTAGNGTTVSGGSLLASGYGSSSPQVSGLANIATQDVPLGSTIAGVADQLVLAVQRVSGTTETFYGSVRWLEQV